MLAAAVVLRFWTPSPMWLDEALTVNIAKSPLHLIPHLLRDDGAPPLYYVLLHFWMKVFGTSDLGARSLSGVIGILTLPVAWAAGYGVGSQSWRAAGATGAGLDKAATDGEASERVARERAGRLVAWTTMLFVATSPFAVYYDTEARMYSLVILLSALGVLAFVAVLRRPTIWNVLALAIVTCGLEYSHYWALFLVASTAIGIALFARSGPHAHSLPHGAGRLGCRDVRFRALGADLHLPVAPHRHALGHAGGLHGARLHLHSVRRWGLGRGPGASPAARVLGAARDLRQPPWTSGGSCSTCGRDRAFAGLACCPVGHS